MSVPFLVDQRLSLLDVCHSPLPLLDVAAAEKRRDRGGFQPEGPGSPWRDLPRIDWRAGIVPGGAYHRTVLVADAGLGKTSNCEWVAGTLHLTHREQVAFFVSIEDLPVLSHKDEPKAITNLVYHALLATWRKAGGCGTEEEFPTAKAVRMLDNLRRAGRLTLVLDSLDQALSRPKAVETLKTLMSDENWKKCPMVVSSRPHALTSQWDTLFKDVASEFRFVRVEEMDVRQQWRLLGTITLPDGTTESRYKLIPPDGRRLLGVPRVIELIRNMGSDRSAYDHLKTMTDVYWKCVNDMLLEGLKADAAADSLIGEKGMGYSASKLSLARNFARGLLGAVAFEMFADTSGKPNVGHVPAGGMDDFLMAVLNRVESSRADHQQGNRFADAKLLETCGQMEFAGKFDAVAAMNAGTLDNYLMDASGRRGNDLKFRNPTMQAFFAAVWVCRHGTLDDIERLKGWVVSPWDDRFGQYQEFWRFVSELGGTGARDASAVRDNRWEDVIGVVYRSRTARMCEFVYRSWERITELKAASQVEFLAEFPAIRDGKYDEDKKRIADEMMAGFIPLAVPGSTLPGDTGTYWLGGTASLNDMPPGSFDPADPPPLIYQAEPRTPPLPRRERVPPFALHRYCVTNTEYELFDPAHVGKRAFTAKVPAGELDHHPVVNVRWYDAWCFAVWCCARLPRELEHVYASEKGAHPLGKFSEMHFDDRFGDSIEDYPYATPRTTPARTIPVASLPANRWGFYHLAGNVWEWCQESQIDQMERSLVGGSWGTFAYERRGGRVAAFLSDECGFRLAYPLPQG